jgi:hypothetical protein
MEKMMKTKTLVTTMALTGALIAATTTVKANPELELISGSSSVIVTAASADGTVTYDGPIGQWNVNVSTGENDLGGITTPMIDLNSLDTAKGYAGTLQSIEILYTALEPASAAGGITGEIGGTTTTTVTDWQWLGYSPFAKTQLLTEVGPFTKGAFSGTAYGTTGTPDGSYWLTEDVLISGGITKATESSSFDSNSSVPDGGMTIAMLGSVLAGLGAIRSRIGKRA